MSRTQFIHDYQGGLLCAIQDLHCSLTGANTDISWEEEKEIYDGIKDRVNNWSTAENPAWWDTFDQIVMKLALQVIFEYEMVIKDGRKRNSRL
jgi:hypothetical protein